MRLKEFKKGDYEIHDRPKLDRILLELCHRIIQGQKEDPEHYGMVAACVLDPDNRKVFGVNQAVDEDTRRHAERVAMDRYEAKYGEIPEGSIILTTLSPCNEDDTHMADERYGESCTDLINGSNVRKVYCGYTDPSQHNDHAEYNLEETDNSDIKNLCKKFADTFLKKSLDESQRFNSLQQVKDYFKRIGKTEAQAATAWQRGYRGPKVKEVKPYDPEKNKNVWYNKTIDEVTIDNHDGAGAVPNNSNVDYMGLRVAMRPSVFLQLATPLATASDPKLVKYIAHGGAIGSPFLQVSIPEAWDSGDFSKPAQVVGHEGRNRMHAIQKLEGDNPIEVHIFPLYYRARDMTPDFVNKLNRHLQVEQSSRIKSGPLFATYSSVAENFSDGKGPGRPGDSQRHGIPKHATMAELERASHSKGRKGQLARWQLNMRRGREK